MGRTFLWCKMEVKLRLQSPDLIQVLDHLAQDVPVLSVLTHLCCDHTWRETKRKLYSAQPGCACVWFCFCACVCLHAFAPATLDEETDEIEEGRVFVLPVKLSPVVDDRLLTHHQGSQNVYLTLWILCPHDTPQCVLHSQWLVLPAWLAGP